MKRWCTLCTALCLLPSVLLAQQVVRERPVTLQLGVDAQGQVVAAEVMKPVRNRDSHGVVQAPSRGPVPDILAKAAREVALRWRFAPPRVGAERVAGTTYARATLQIVRTDEGVLHVRLEYRGNGPFIQDRTAPRFPVSMYRRHASGAVVIEAVMTPSGSISKPRVIGHFGPHNSTFAETALEAVRYWKGTPMQVDGRAGATRVRIPILFQSGPRPDRDWPDIMRKVDQATAPDSATAVPQKLESGEAVALDSPFMKAPSG